MQLRFVTGLDVTRVSAHFETFVKSRLLDDHATVYCELSNGGKGMVRASQVCIGHKNDMAIEVAGTKGTLVWRQEEPEKVVIMLAGQPDRVYWRGDVQPNDGFLGDVPEWLLKNRAFRRDTPKASTTPTRVCTASSKRTFAHGRKASPSRTNTPATLPSSTAEWAWRS